MLESRCQIWIGRGANYLRCCQKEIGELAQVYFLRMAAPQTAMECKQNTHPPTIFGKAYKISFLLPAWPWGGGFCAFVPNCTGPTVRHVQPKCLEHVLSPTVCTDKVERAGAQLSGVSAAQFSKNQKPSKNQGCWVISYFVLWASLVEIGLRSAAAVSQSGRNFHSYFIFVIFSPLANFLAQFFSTQNA